MPDHDTVTPLAALSPPEEVRGVPTGSEEVRQEATLSLKVLANFPSDSLGGGYMRREDLLKPDLMSEVLLLGFGALLFAILLLILFAAWTQAPALV